MLTIEIKHITSTLKKSKLIEMVRMIRVILPKQGCLIQLFHRYTTIAILIVAFVIDRVPGLILPLKKHNIHKRAISQRNYFDNLHRHHGVISIKSLQQSTKDDVSNENIQTVEVSSFSTLSKLLHPPINYRIEQMSTTDLAYIGDVVYELFIRCRTVWPPKRTSDLQNQVVTIVRAEHQANLLKRIRGDDNVDEINNTTHFIFTSDEEKILSRGRNTQNARKQHKNPVAYQDSTAFEAVLGYIYLTNSTRCAELLDWINLHGLE